MRHNVRLVSSIILVCGAPILLLRSCKLGLRVQGSCRIDDMLRSALISVLSACLAVCTTLLFQKYWLSTTAGPQQHVPATAATTAKTDAQQHHQEGTSHTIPPPPPPPPGIDLAQALGLGRVLLSRGEQEEAALVYRVAAQATAALEDAAGSEGGGAGTNRDGGEAHHGLGLALLAAGRLGEALEACREAERLDRLSAAASSCVGALLTKAGDTSGAVQALRRALEKAVVAREGSETVDDIRGRLGGALLDAGEVDEAISVLTSGTAGTNGNVAYNLGVAWQTKVACFPSEQCFGCICSKRGDDKCRCCTLHAACEALGWGNEMATPHHTVVETANHG